ncbi:MAG TPA: CopD family protein [Gemmatimonadaceae bacterium]|nr:CopD family protein [Gemmatimonadaceae bacterium]
MSILHLLQDIAQTAQGVAQRPPGGPAAEHAFSFTDALFELIQFLGWFLSVGAIGFRFGVARHVRGISDDARRILAADNAAALGAIGVILLFVSYLGGPLIESMTSGKAFTAVLPRNRGQFEVRMTVLAIALIGFLMVRASAMPGWILASLGVTIAVLFPIYTGRGAGKINAVHIFAASAWLGTLLVLTIVGIRGVIARQPSDTPHTILVADLVNSFSPLALTAACVVALSGLTTAWLHLKRISSLWTTSYGVMLIIKLIFVAIVVSLGAWNWRRIRPSLGDPGTEQTIRRSATMELTFGAIVLICTAILVTLPSPR